jgi:hypothetical protein
MKINLLSIIQFFINYGGPFGYLKKYGRILKTYGKAWEAGDIDAIINHFDDQFIYTDPIAQQGIFTKPALRQHLEDVFQRFPRQKWTINTMLYPHYTLFKFAISYEFSLEGHGPNYSGTGMEKIEFRGEKLIEDRIHLIFKELDSRTPLGFKI